MPQDPAPTYAEQRARDDALALVERQRRADEQAALDRAPAQKVVLTGVRLPFKDVLTLAVQVGIAAIPAGVIVALVWGLVARVLLGK